jgi:hypothetical protein
MKSKAKNRERIMTPIEINLFIALLVLCFWSAVGVNAAYRNGVTDGYGYAREPMNPGYQKAGRYLREHMAYRWRELRNKWDGI